MGLIVAGVGLTGTAHVLGYLQERLLSHGIHHNRDIAENLLPYLRPVLDSTGTPSRDPLQRTLERFGSLGYRLFVVDRARRLLVADSRGMTHLPVPIDSSWLAGASSGIEGQGPLRLVQGPAVTVSEGGLTTLIWLQQAGAGTSSEHPWLLGVASDQNTLVQFLGDLHWHLDLVLLITFVLIALLGHMALRGIGRMYERDLEAQVRQRTRELDLAHEAMVRNTRLAAIGQTASMLAHEMRNPLASIKLALGGLKDYGAIPERERRRVALVSGEVDRLDALLSETLDYVRPLQLSMEQVDVELLIAHVIRQQQPLLRKKAITVDRTKCNHCPAMRLDKAKMHQVLLNLLKNAVEASPPGSRIHVRHYRDGTIAMVEVANPGDPIPPEVLERVFEPFCTTKPRGSGLGLVLVKRVVEEHGGQVIMASDAREGTRVILRLPLAATATTPLNDS
ncbi:MAG: ATP-binding protein [Gammaproteobacteria bacterium]|nr:ATP-binding protein [Gammaproteobacteria bacterium]